MYLDTSISGDIYITNYLDPNISVIDIIAATGNVSGSRVEQIRYYINILANRQKIGVYINNIVVYYPAVFTIAAEASFGFRVRLSELGNVISTGDVKIGTSDVPTGTEIKINATDDYATNTSAIETTIYVLGGTGGGTIVFPKKSKIHYLYISSPGLGAITGSITGMALTYLFISSPGLGAITGSITGMALTYLLISNPGLGAITGSITGMALTYLYIQNPGAGAITYTEKLSYNTRFAGMLSNNGILFTSTDNGENNPTPQTITFETGGSNKSFGITRVGAAITVQLATDGSGVSTTTANELIAAWNQADIIPTLSAACDGTGTVPAMTTKTLTMSLAAITSATLSATSLATATEYRALLMALAAKTSSLTSVSIAETSLALCPTYLGDNDLAGSQQVKVAVDAIIVDVGAAAFSSAWKTNWGI